MKSFDRFYMGVLLLFCLSFVGLNIYLSSLSDKENGRFYQVEISRIQKEIEKRGLSVDLSKYSTINNVTRLEDDTDQIAFFAGNGSDDYVIRDIGGSYYRIDYRVMMKSAFREIRLTVDIAMLGLAMIFFALLYYLRVRIIKPFHHIKDIPYELSKGNLTTGMKENKARYFGRFIWGLNLLREHLEEQKKKELALQKEKKTLVLSLSHDIKTPLSAIKLYSKALIRNLYDNDEKRIEIAEKIGFMADEIERYVADIITASSENFLDLKVNDGEFYLKELMDKICFFYIEKLSLLKIEFKVEKYDNCLLKADLERVEEVMQNIIENAIKYGDGRYISLTINREEDCCLITVANSGSSLPQRELSFIFDSFWRGSNVGTYSGNGLGLYISRQLMKKMNGDIYASDQNGDMLLTIVVRLL